VRYLKADIPVQNQGFMPSKKAELETRAFLLLSSQLHFHYKKEFGGKDSSFFLYKHTLEGVSE
jgi:hypothetical protein